MICLSWVVPLRILTLVSLFGNAGYTAYTIHHTGAFSLTMVFLSCIHIGISLSILSECRRSVEYHSQLKS